ncbi:MAG: carboxy terminal-processing peptidase [Verrucomicrobiota bacterium]|nr:carboxy terminal-processing peptidase [Verrucomicrobiota bacterium]
MKKSITIFTFLITALLPFTLPVSAKLDPTQEMAAQTRWVVDTINARHYLRDSMEQLNGTEIVEAYIASFDYGRMYFTRPEVDDFIFRFGDSIEEFLNKGNLYAAFEIYESFKHKAESRTEWIFARLKEDITFVEEEAFMPDRRDAQWPGTRKIADQLWLRRLKYELLNEILSLVSDEEGQTGEPLSINKTDSLDPGASGERNTFDPTELRRLIDDKIFFAEILNQAREKIRRRYERNLGYTIAREAAEAQESFINSMTQLFDPHSSFLSSDTLESFNSSVQNSFVGIGALLEDDDGICTIKEILPGGPAERSRLLGPEDQILGVAQGDEKFEDVVDLQLRYIVRKIKGEKGTTVRLLIRPGNTTDPSVRKIVPIVRDEVKLTANLATAKLVHVPDGSSTIPVGVIELPSFYGNIGAGNTLTTTTDDVTELLNKLKNSGAQGIILDLRMNGGGLLSEAVRVAGLFIPVGPVVQVLDSSGRKDVLSDRDPRMLWDGPIIVLTSRFSASASEIVAGALQDHSRALIVGNSSTHGKGTVQEVYHMNKPSPFSFFRIQKPQARPVASKITIKQFFLPGGSSTQVKGVPSDIALPSVNEFLPIGENDLPHALPWDEIAPVDWVNDWEKLQVVSAQDPDLIQSLLKASKVRQGSLEEFQFLGEQIQWRRKRYEEKTISINLSLRIEQKIKDKEYIDRLDSTYESLSEQDYESEDFVLKVVKEQEVISEETLSEPKKLSSDRTSKENETAKLRDPEEEDKSNYDIYLREAARIMVDWLNIENQNASWEASKPIAIRP